MGDDQSRRGTLIGTREMIHQQRSPALGDFLAHELDDVGLFASRFRTFSILEAGEEAREGKTADDGEEKRRGELDDGGLEARREVPRLIRERRIGADGVVPWLDKHPTRRSEQNESRSKATRGKTNCFCPPPPPRPLFVRVDVSRCQSTTRLRILNASNRVLAGTRRTGREDAESSRDHPRAAAIDSTLPSPRLLSSLRRRDHPQM